MFTSVGHGNDVNHEYIHERFLTRQDRKLILIINFLFKNQVSNQCLNVGVNYLPLESKNIGHILKSLCMYSEKHLMLSMKKKNSSRFCYMILFSTSVIT